MSEPAKSKEERIADLARISGVPVPLTGNLIPIPELAIMATVAYLRGHITRGRLREEFAELYVPDAWARMVTEFPEGEVK